MHFNEHRPHRALHHAAPLQPLQPPASQSVLRLDDVIGSVG
jgi:hypothetical protein